MDKQWTKSTFCESGTCVEVLVPVIGDVLLRRSRDRLSGNTILTFTKDEWDAFIQGVKAGEFDL